MEHGVTTVLVADDDLDICRLLTLNLELEGYDVVCAYDGSDARQKVDQVTPDIVVLDVMMPGQDGIQVLNSLKRDESTKDIPVMMLTAKRSDADVWEGWRSGADCYITKPFEVDRVLHYVEALANGDTASDEPMTEWVSDRPETAMSGVLRSLGSYWDSEL